MKQGERDAPDEAQQGDIAEVLSRPVVQGSTGLKPMAIVAFVLAGVLVVTVAVLAITGVF